MENFFSTNSEVKLGEPVVCSTYCSASVEMKVKKVRQIATSNIRLRLSGVKYLLLSFCFVSSLHQTLPSHFEV